MPQPNDIIGPYVVLRRLGHGGFGEVWLAERRSSLLSVPLALKLPLPPFADPDTIRDEARIWLRASGHPNVVPVLDAEEYDGQVVIASEFIAGGSLADRLQNRVAGVHAPEEAVRIVEGILSGLVHLHAAGIIHRDLKPANVLLQGGIPRLTDFGLARALSGSNISMHLSGSPHYMAPETFSGAYSAASDLWAAGVILYELISGGLPFDQPDVMQVITAIREDRPAPLPDGTPRAIRALVERLLARLPEDRFESAEEALGALRGSSGGNPSGAARDAAIQAAEPDAREPGPGFWYVQLMGAMQIASDAGTVTELPTRKSAALLARLAFEPGKAYRREELMEMLWPGTTLEQQRNNMSVELHRLRQRMALPGIPGRDVLRGVEMLSLNPDVARSDTNKMMRTVERARAAVQSVDRLALLQEALGLFQPAFLPDFDQEWIEPARESLDRLYLETAEKLVTEFGHRGEHDLAIEAAQGAVDNDRFAEERHGLLIFALIQAARPCDALRHYEEMAKLWQEEYGGEPGSRARKLGAEAKRRCEAQPVVSDSPPPAHNGPVLPATFLPILGREPEIARLDALLQDPDVRLVTLTGAGGTGKTRLAIETAKQLCAAFNSAVWFVPLADLTERATILDSLRNTLGIASSPGADPLNQIVQHLSAQTSLLIFDNFEHLAATEASLVASLLERAPTLKCLVTSRQSLQLSMETLFEVPPLTVPEAASGKPTTELDKNACVQLFLQRAQRAKPDFALTAANAPAVVDLCRRLDGIPLAIELAAAWARMLTPADMLAQLKGILVSRDRSVARQHRSLDAVIEASFARLPEELQRFVLHLSVFRGGWTADAARQVCDEPLALTMLGELQDASLILSHESGSTMRFRMLEPVREYAQDRLSESSERLKVAARCTDYYLGFARDAEAGLRGPEQADWLHRLEEDLPNLRSALASAEDSLCLKAASGLQRFWVARGRISEGREWMGGAMDALEALDEKERGGVMLSAGIMALMAGDVEVARAYLHSSVAYCRVCEDDRGAVKALANLANIEAQLGHYDEARKAYEAGLEVARRSGDDRLTVTLLNNLGAMYLFREDYSGACERLEQAVSISAHLSADLVTADIYHNLADVYRNLEDHSRALHYVHESLVIRDRMGDFSRMPHTLLHLAAIGIDLREYRDTVILLAGSARATEILGYAPSNCDDHAEYIGLTREHLSEGELESAWAIGMSLTAQEIASMAFLTSNRWLGREDSHGPEGRLT